MSKVLPRKPGPKSVKQSKILSHRGTLGETSGESESDDTSPEDTLTTPKHSKVAGNVSDFRTPDTEQDATDYGLEFTTSHIQHASPRRCSTLKTAASSQEEQSSGGRVSINRGKSNKGWYK